LDEYEGDRAMVGEVFLLTTEQVAAYYGKGDELHLSFNFPPLFAPWEAEAWRQHIEAAASVLDPIAAWPTWVLSNHDQKRHRTRYGSESLARSAALLLLTLRGTPFLYMGEELGLEDAVVPADRVVDPNDRDGCRAPIPWTTEDGHGWGADPWLPWPPDPSARSVEALKGDPGSILQLYRRLLAARRASPALQRGALTLLASPEGVLVWERSCEADRRTVVLNFSREPCAVEVMGSQHIEVASDGRGEGELFDGTVAAEQALVLTPK
jgi:alpha-glucosidase